ncbi:bifunctional 4-hydroxy-2-oxoglutarate aldolase/2-dehydro-3-deoxy-phosphogluconate aldolase [Spirochaetota bacterium]
MSVDVLKILEGARIVPVAVLEDSTKALKVAELLLEHSINILEITLRTDEALECIRVISEKIPQIVLAAGSVLTKDALGKAVDCGAKFAVSPMLDPDIINFSNSLDIPFIPGITTPTELNEALKHTGIVKIFPSQHIGGVGYIKSILAPFGMMDFRIFPTGGIDGTNYQDYLNIDKVIACGMSYIVDRKLVEKDDYKSLGKRMKEIMSGLPS